MENQKKKQQLAADEAAKKAQAEQQQQQHNEKSSASEDQPPAQQEEEEEKDEVVASAEEDVSDDEEEEEEEDEEEEDDNYEHLEELYQRLVGKKVNKSGMVIDRKSGVALGRLVEGKAKRVSGKKVGEHGEIVNDKGKVVGRVEPIDENESSDEDDNSGNEEEEPANQEEEEEKTKETAKVAEGVTDKAKDTAEEAEAAEEAEGVTDKVKDTAEEAEEAEEATDKAKDTTEEAEEAEEATDKAKDTTEEAEGVTDKAKETTEEAEEAEEAEGVTDKVKDTAEEAEEAEEATDKAKDTTEEAEGVTDKAKETTEEAEEAEEAEGVTDKAKETTEEAEEAEEATDMAKDTTDKTEKEVEDLEVNKDQGEDTAAIVDSGAAADTGEEEEAENKVDENSPVVKKSGKVLDSDDNVVGHVDPRIASRLAGFKVDQEGNVINDEGEVVGVAEMIKPEEPVEEAKPFNPNELVNEDSPEVKKSGKVVDMEDNVVGSVDERVAVKYAGCKVDPEGNVINQEGHIVARADMLKEAPVPEEEKPVDENSPEVRKSGKVFDMDDELVGHVDKKNAVKWAGFKVDEEGNVYDQEGQVVGTAEMIKPPAEEEKPKYPNSAVDEDSPEVRKSGKVVDMDDNIVGTVDNKNAVKWAGFKVDEEGNVYDQEGQVVGTAEMIKPPPEEEKSKYPNSAVDEDSPEVRKSGKVVDMDDNIVGTVDKRSAVKWAGFKVDEEGKVYDQEGQVVGTAEMIKPPPEEEKPKYPNSAVDDSSPEVRKSGKVVDMNDNIVGTVDPSDAHKWAGFKVDWDGNVIDKEGNMVGKAEMSKILTEEERKEQQDEEEYRRIADQMSGAIQHSLDQIKPVLKSITDSIEAEESKPEQDRDEEKLVETVKPLIEQGSSILNEAYGAIHGLDPTGRIAKKAQARTQDRNASPEEYHLADLLSQLTGEVTTTIDKAKKKIKGMPKAKKALSPLWNILQSPLLQILSAVGLLLSGVLGLVGQILNGLGLGGIINSVLGGIGLNKILEGFGLGHALNLAGNKK